MRTIIASCLFNDPEIMVESLEHMKTTLGKHRELWVLDQHWPLSKQKTHDRMVNVFGHGMDDVHLLDAGKNLGLHHGYNYIFEKAGLTDGDLVLCVDPDTWLETPCWDMAMERVLQHPNIPWVCTMNAGVETEQNVGWQHAIIDGVSIMAPQRPCIQSICGFKYSWIKRIGGFNEPSAFYGGLECFLWSQLMQGEHVAYLPDFRDDFFHFGPRGIAQYNEYKIAHAHKGSWKGDFESFLKDKYPNLL